MANLAICDKKTGKIKKFLYNCVRKGSSFVGSNGRLSISNRLEDKFNLIWTNDDVETSYSIKTADNEKSTKLFNKTQVDLKLLEEFEGEVVSSSRDVDKVALSKLRSKYSEYEELCILRGKIIGDLSATVWNEYITFVTDLKVRVENYKRNHINDN